MNVTEPYKSKYRLRIEESAPFHIFSLVLMVLVILFSLCLVLTTGESQSDNVKSGNYAPLPTIPWF